MTEEKRRIRIGNQTAYFAGSPVDPFVYAVENGFDAFEWFPDRRDDSGWSEEDIGHDTRAWIAKTALKNDIRLSVHAAWWTNPLRPESHAALSAAEMFAVDIGACLLNIHLFTGDGIPRFLESLLPLVRRLSGAGITLTLENTPGTCPDDLNEFFRLLAASQTDISGVGMCLDIGHANLCESTRNDYLRYVDELGQHVPIRHVHLHENSGDSDSHLTLFTGPAGRDPAGIEGLVERLERRLFSGAMILEQWPEPRDLLVDARQRLVSMFNNTAGPGSDPRVVSRGTSVAESPAVTSQPDDGGETPMIIYNLFPLLAGRLGKWEDHFTRASEMGFTWIFVNPVQLTGPSGSIYSIADYFAFNPLLLDEESGEPPEEQVRAMLRSAHRLGLRVMVDLVINHCSADSPLLRSHPEWFAWEAPGRVSHPFANEDGKKVVWKDLAQFDFKNTRDGEGLFRYILGIVTFLSGLGFDGFRCDAAYQVPRKIWEGLIRETRKDYPEAVFFAETLGCTPELTKKTASAGFDYIFNSSKWWDFRAPWLMEQYALTRDIAPSISFPESHDTARLGEEMFGNINGLKQRLLFSAFFSAGIMLPIGLEFGFRKRLHVVSSRPEDWEETGIDLTRFITALTMMKRRHGIFLEDAPSAVLPHVDPAILLLWKGSPHTREEALLILNTDIRNSRRFHEHNLRGLFQSAKTLVDRSPECPMDYVPPSLACELRPGQGIVLVTVPEAAEED